jgi:hypothetical protein
MESRSAFVQSTTTEGSDFVDMSFELRDQLGREEWEAIFPVPNTELPDDFQGVM